MYECTNAIGYDLLAQLKYTFTTNLKLHFHQSYQVWQTKATFVLFFSNQLVNCTRTWRKFHVDFALSLYCKQTNDVRNGAKKVDSYACVCLKSELAKISVFFFTFFCWWWCCLNLKSLEICCVVSNYCHCMPSEILYEVLR